MSIGYGEERRCQRDKDWGRGKNTVTEKGGRRQLHTCSWSVDTHSQEPLSFEYSLVKHKTEFSIIRHACQHSERKYKEEQR